MAWAGFALAAAAVLIWNWLAMRGVAGPDREADDPGWRPLATRRALPLYTAGLVFGITSAIYLSFAADRFAATDGPAGVSRSAIPALVFVFYGSCGLLGLLADRLRARLGMVNALRLLLVTAALSLLLVALIPGRWAGLVLSAGLQGITVMMLSAVFAMWADSLFPALTSRGMTALLLAVSAGSVIGPVAAGMIETAFGPVAMFTGAAILPVLAAAWLRDPAVGPEESG